MKNSIIDTLATVGRHTDKLVGFLTASDYFTAPASTKYHLSCAGGLATHSWNVYEELKRLNEDRGIGIPLDSVIICGLLHDLCKVSFYERANKRVRDDKGNWNDKEVWAVNDAEPLGHGEKSVIVAQRYVELLPDEIVAIRWHMGAWDAEGYTQRRNLSAAMDACKLVKALMVADQMATYWRDK